MQRLASIQDFTKFSERLASGHDPSVPTVVIPAGTCGQASGANDLILAAKAALIGKKLAERVNLLVTGCHGFCQAEPSVLVTPRRVFYPKVAPADMERIVVAAAEGDVCRDLLTGDPATGAPIETQEDVPFFRGQRRTIISRNETVDPQRISTAIAGGAYRPFAWALDAGRPERVLDEVKASGLRGRGGAGFPTGAKWEMLAAQKNGRGKVLVCNADEGDPGAYMDRSVLEGNPHAVIEGMLLGAFATGATEGIVYVRSEYPLAVKHLSLALRQARDLGLLGENILGTGFSFDIAIVKGAGAFVCGEETALIRSIEGRMGEPRQRPPFPVARGVNGKPTAINNVETWANIPEIVRGRGAAYAETGVPGSTGTKIFSLVGKVKRTGLVEVAMGTPLREIVEGIGGGPSGRAPLKAVQTGGPSGGCIPEALLDLPVDYASLAKAGSIMGSGGMIVMDAATCMVDVARYFMGFLKDESCGKCFTCRKGTQRMHEILTDITEGKGTPEHVELLAELASVMKDTTMCGLGQTAANPVLSTLRYFRDEYEAHVRDRRCPAGVCRALITFYINDRCTGCGACAKACAFGAITGEKKKPHVIDAALCNKCGSCRAACAFGAVTVL